MTRPSIIDKLPPDIRQELTRRIISDGYGQYNDIADWLTSLGYKAGKSAIHRFGQKLKVKRDSFREDEFSMALQSKLVITELRMRCIEAATQVNAADVLLTAQTYLDWVNLAEK